MPAAGNTVGCDAADSVVSGVECVGMKDFPDSLIVSFADRVAAA